MRYHFIPIRMAKTKCSNVPDVSEDEDKLDHPHTEDGKKVQSFWTRLWQFLVNWTCLSCNPAVVPWSIYSRSTHKNNLYANVRKSFTFVIAPNRKQPKCPSTSDGLNKLWYIHTMKYYSAVKRTELLIHRTSWIHLSELRWVKKKSQSQKLLFAIQSVTCIQLFVTPWTTAHQASLSFTISLSLLKLSLS